MKESVTKFDLEAAFKALDEIDTPKVTEGIKANRPALTEIFSKKTKLESLLEDYYDVSNMNDLSDAKDARDAEIAKAKLARIEKIVDLNAESPEDLLMSYVGKIIIQCPQCMTLFYKDQEDIVEDESDPTNVNVNEVCQHCGNETGYTLVGKVGEVTPEEAENYESAEETVEDDVTEVDVQGTDDAETEITDDEIDLEDLEDIDLDLEIEDDETDDVKEESLQSNENQLLTESLEEGKEVDSFEELISSPEFKKPISDTTVRAMLNELDESKKNFNFTEDLSTAEFPAIAGFDHKVTNTFKDGDFEGNNIIYSKDGIDFVETEVWDANDPIIVSANLYAPNLMQQVYDNFETFSNDLKYKVSKYLKESSEPLNEGPFSKLKDKISNVVKATTNALKSREDKANWILENAIESGAVLGLNDEGNLNIEQNAKRFHKFAVLGFTGKYNDGSVITISPYSDNERLVSGMATPVLKDTYQDADATAKAWSMRQDNGPAFIYLVKTADDENAVFLCSYFEGKLDTKKDMLDKYFKAVQKDLEGAKIEAEQTAKHTKADEETEKAETEQEANNESLSLVINDLDDLQEASLEKHVTDYLIENYNNIAGFRLNECSYLNESLQMTGKLFLTDGTVNSITFDFTEAYNKDDNKVILEGLSSEYGAEKLFTLAGLKDTDNKTFITESFTCKEITK